MNYEHIKNKVTRYAVSEFRNDFALTGNKMVILLHSHLLNDNRKNILSEAEDQIVSIIQNWDIRNMYKLVELFPKCFPKWVIDKNYTIDYNGSWSINKTERG